MTTFVERLDSLRKKHDLNVTEACELIGVPYPTYYNWVHGDSFPRPDGIKKIAEAYGVTTAWLMTGEEPAKEAPTKKEEPEVVPKPEREVVTEETIPTKPSEPARTYKIYENPQSRSRSVRYHSKDAQALQDINTVINQIKYMNIDRDKKKSVHKTMSEIRMDLECKVFYGDDDM